MGDAGPGQGFRAINPLGLGSPGGGPPGSTGQMAAGGGSLFMGGAYAPPSVLGPAGGFGVGSGLHDIGAAFTGRGAVPGLALSSATARSQTNALVSFTTFFGSWKDGWEAGIIPGTLFFPVKSMHVTSGDSGRIEEGGGEIKTAVSAPQGGRIVPAPLPTINWLLEESARVASRKHEAGGMLTGVAAASQQRREWAFVGREGRNKEGAVVANEHIDYRDRFVRLFGRMPMMEINKGPAYDDNPLGGFDPVERYRSATKRTRAADHPHQVAVPPCDGYVCNTPNIWGSPHAGDKLSLRLRYFDSRIGGEWANPYTAFTTPDGRRADHGRTENTGFLQLWPCVYSKYGADPSIDPNGSYCIPHKTSGYDEDPHPWDLDWMHKPIGDDFGDGVGGTYQHGLEIFIGTVKDTPEAYDIVGNPAPLRDQQAYNSLPQVSIIFG